MDNLRSKIFLGFVVENKDPKRVGRCKIRVLNIFDQVGTDGTFSIPNDDLPWATPWKDLNGNMFNLPEVGKLVSVVFEDGDIYKPEYIFSEHYNGCMEDNLKQLSDTDYTSMKALLFDHKTQIYVNELEGLKIEHKWGNLNIEDKKISLNIADNNSTLMLGDAAAGQSVILGDHFLSWFDRFLTAMVSSQGFTQLPGVAPGPIPPAPTLIQLKGEFDSLLRTKFLSEHVKVVDNNAVTVVKQTAQSFPVHRVNFGISGDFWMKFGKLNEFAKKLPDLPLPWGAKKKRVDPKYKSPQEKNPNVPLPNSSQVINPNNPDNAKSVEGNFDPLTSQKNSNDFSKVNSNRQVEYFEDDDEIAKVVRYLESKTGKNPVSGQEQDYEIYEDPYVLNIVAFRNKSHEFGKITNAFDDELWVFYKDDKDQWQTLQKFTVTTVPGYKVVDGKLVDPPVLPEGASFINYGQYSNSYKLGYHNTEDYGKRLPALVCEKVGIRVNKKKGVFEKGKYVNTVTLTQFGPDVDGWVYGGDMNVHLAMSTDDSLYGSEKYPKATIIYNTVNNWSMGCVVFNNPEQYRIFIGLCDEQRTKGKKSQFTLTVASAREFSVFETDADLGSDLLSFDVPDDRFPELPRPSNL
jgi:hypothetical protein